MLLLLDTPTAQAVRAQYALDDWIGALLSILLSKYGMSIADVRVEYVIQCHAKTRSKEMRRAIDQCAPSLQPILAGMPNLQLVLAFGEVALQEAGGWAPSSRLAREVSAANKKLTSAHAKAMRAYERSKVPYLAKHAKWWARWRKWVDAHAVARAKGRAFKRKRPQEPKVPVPPGDEPVLRKAPPAQGPAGITLFRGSPLKVAGREDVILLPLLEPEATQPFMQPRLRPLLAVDFAKGMGLLKGTRTVPPIQWQVLRTLRQAEDWLRELRARRGDVGLDIEWSRQQGSLMCIGLGAALDYAIIPYLERERGVVWEPGEWLRLLALLQAALDDPALSWGGHNVCGYDERKLRQVGLRMQSKWDSLAEFHLLFAEFGSPRDDTSVQTGAYTQASGYDLGFVSSVLTDFPYHKGVVTGSIDAYTVDTEKLYAYCVGDVARTYHIRQATRKEAASLYGADIAKYERLLALELATMRRASAMTLRGVPIAEGLRRERHAFWTAKHAALIAEAGRIVGDQAFNLGSSHQLARKLAEEYGISVRYDAETGKPKLDAKIIDRLVVQYADNPLLRLVGGVREASKEASAYAGLTPAAHDGRAHPSWKVHGTVGARWSSTPNFQNITKQQREVIR